jgi:FMN phosphatase YigB (HAD superfamily)
MAWIPKIGGTTTMRLLDRYPVLLLDMGGTFMFRHDRFGEEEDFYKTYQSLGGDRLSAGDVEFFIRLCFDGIIRDYHDPAYCDHFPTLAEAFRRYARPAEEDLPLLEQVFASHEVGIVPDVCAALLRRLARTHRLALVSNIWSPKGVYLAEFKRAGITGVFHHIVFSSDFRSIKPSPVLFQEALRGVGAQAHGALFVGDSLHYDMEGARRVGLATAWITHRPIPHESVDYILSSLQEIETVTV